MRIIKMLIWVVIFAFCGLVAFSLYLYFSQDRMVFYPMPEILVSPGDVNLPFEDVRVKVSPTESIHAWYVPGSESGNGRTVLFCHGNAGNISHRLETLEFLHEMGANVFLFDYRGYGLSDGEVGEENAYADAEACYWWLIEQKAVAPADLVIFGRSLGGAVGIDLASRVVCAGLIVESSFTSVEDMGKRMFPGLPIKYLLRFHFDSIDKVDQVNCPIVVSHSVDDEIVPFEMGKRLFEAAREPKRFVELSGGHNDRFYFGDKSYHETIGWLMQGNGGR